MSHNDKIKDCDAFFEVDPITRQIKNMTPAKVVLMQGDHNSEKFTFSLPRYIEGHDMAESAKAKLHYVNPTKPDSGGMYEMTDLQIDESDAERVKCSWLISANVTKEPGAISFLIEFECYEGNVLVYSWHTAPFTGISIGATFDFGEEIAVQYADVLEQWEQRLFDANSQAVKDVETAKADALQEVENAGGTLFANALKGTASGETVTVNDVSPLEHMARAKVSGKNLFGFAGRVVSDFNGYDKSSIRTFKGNAIYLGLSTSNYYQPDLATYTVDGNNKINVSSLRDWYGVGVDIEVKPNTTYVASGDFPEGGVMGIAQYDASGKHLGGTSMKNKAFTTSNTTRWIVAILLSSTANSGIDFANIQLEEGNTATEYEPYIDPTTATVTRYGADESDNAQTFTPEADGTVLIPSMSPTMTVLTDTEGVNIDLEYNQDTNKAVGAVKEDIRELDRVVAEHIAQVEGEFGKIIELVESVNLLNTNDPDYVVGGFLDGNGNIASGANYRVSGYIECKNGDIFTMPCFVKRFGEYNAKFVYLYDENKTFIRTFAGVFNADKTLITVTINNNNACYFRMNDYADSNAMIVKGDTYPSKFVPYGESSIEFTSERKEEIKEISKENQNVLFGKQAIFDGDSICDGISANDNKDGWAGRIGTKNSMDWHNEGISGGTIKCGLNYNGNPRHWISSNIDSIYSKYPNLDYLILEGGTNDADLLGADGLGTISTTSFMYSDFDNTEDFTQALEYLFSKAIALYPTKKIGFIIAHKMGGNASNYRTQIRRTYFDRCKEVCEKYGIPCLDLWYGCHLNPTIDYATHENAYYMYTDGQHLSSIGYDYVSDIIEAWMKTL